jgi:DedD protein
MEAIPPQLPATKLGNEKSGSATAPTPIPVPQTPPPKAAIVTPTPTPTPAPTKVEPKPAPEAVKVPPRVETPKPELVKPEPPKVEPPKAAPPVVAPKAVDSKGAFVVQIGAYKDADNAQQIVARMKEAKLVVFTDKIATQSGEVTRVRVGPFSTREKADAALAQVKLAGSDGKVVPQ